jgi:hypothetical protein
MQSAQGPNADRDLSVAPPDEVTLNEIEIKAYLSLKERVGAQNRRPLRPGATVGSLATELGFTPEELGLTLLNGCKAELSTPLSPGDRVAYFPEYVPFHKIYGMCVV